MRMKPPILDNQVRSPLEWYSAFAMGTASILCGFVPQAFFMPPTLMKWLALGLAAGSLFRFVQGMKVVRYQKRLLILPMFSMGTCDVPISKTYLYVGQGFRWQPIHRQRLHLLSLLEHQKRLRRPALYEWVQSQAKKHPEGLAEWLSQLPHSPFKPMPPVGGKPWLHGVGSKQEASVLLQQVDRRGHAVVFGRTGVGKTRFMSIEVNQDIRNGEAVLVIDPKGDTDLVKDMYAACKSAGRLRDFMVLHAGMPDLSAKYNPLAAYSDISEVATRVTNAIQAEGEGKQFQAFAWKFLNITATCLKVMDQPINYKSLAFFVMRPKELLLAYCDLMLPSTDPNYFSQVQSIINASEEANEKKKEEPISRAEAVKQYVGKRIEEIIGQGDHQNLQDDIIADLYLAAQTSEEYYGKITASLGPVFDKINRTAAGDIFSWEGDSDKPVINLETAIHKKQVIYIGLDALSNKAMSEAVGQAVIADLISLCGRLYKENPDAKRALFLHADEFNEIVRDEFIVLLNKAGGAGVRVTAYTQTVNDLGAVFGSNKDKPKMLLGNFGTIVMLRIANDDTAKMLTDCLEQTNIRSALPSSTSSDHALKSDQESYATQNNDLVQEEKSALITVNDLYALPKGQAFILTNGGELYKVRMPLPTHDESSETNVAYIISEVNRCYGYS